jgi:predicted TIM-barrel fold metal-dependent hydrolase
MQIDSHVHFLIYNAQEHIWVTDELSALEGSFLPQRPRTVNEGRRLRRLCCRRGVAARGLFPCIEVALELFGPKRVILGSISPVCTMAGRFEAVIGAYLDGIRALSPADRAEILAGTSVRCYRLAP